MSEKRKIGYYKWRSKDSLWMSVRAGVDPETGQSIRHTKTVKGIKEGDEREAEKALAKFIADVEKGKYKKPSKMTLKQLSERFMRDNPNLSKRTKSIYQANLDQRILPSLGDNKIDRIKPTHIYDYLDCLREDGIRGDGKPGGLSPATIQKDFHILSSMFTFAVDLGEIEAEKDPTKKVKTPKVPKRKPVSLDKDPSIDLLRALQYESLKYKAIVLIAATTALRRGEILGISDRTLDTDNCIIKVYDAVGHTTEDGIYIDDPKSDSSVRATPFPKSILPVLLEMIAARNKQRNKCGDRWVDEITVRGELVKNDLLFTQWNGKPMHPNTIDKWFAKFKIANGLPDSLKFHGLRHTNISLLLGNGVDISTVAANSGHAKKSTTLNVYADPLPSLQRYTADKIDELLELDKIIPDLLGKPTNIRHKKQTENKQVDPD